MARINLPPVTRVLVGALIFQSVLGAAVRYRHWVAGTSAERTVVIPYLTLVPQLSIVYPWTIATTSLVESNIFTLSAGIATLFYGGRYLERAWSSRELAKYMAIVTVVPNLLTAFVLVVLFALSRNEAWT